VPNVVGRTWDDAREVLRAKGLFGVSPDDDGPAVGAASGIVADQSPESGAKVPIGSRVLLWVQRGDGGAGVREPRRPKPTPGHGYEWRPEPSDEAVS
jgi:beta-lactam-binding protein with PASTA domain